MQSIGETFKLRVQYTDVGPCGSDEESYKWVICRGCAGKIQIPQNYAKKQTTILITSMCDQIICFAVQFEGISNSNSRLIPEEINNVLSKSDDCIYD